MLLPLTESSTSSETFRGLFALQEASPSLPLARLVLSVLQRSTHTGAPLASAAFLQRCVQLATAAKIAVTSADCATAGGATGQSELATVAASIVAALVAGDALHAAAFAGELAQLLTAVRDARTGKAFLAQ